MIRKILSRSLLVILLLHAVFIGISSAFIIYYKYHTPPTTGLMLYRNLFCNQKVRAMNYVKLQDIPDDILKMIIATEDYRFNEHSGIDIDSIKRAYFINKKAGYFMYGGSTITQQLARTLFLCPKKLLVRKYLEIIVAFELELILSKNRILELYVNYSEWGAGIYGISAASQKYYNRDINALSTDEIARMIAILASPLSNTPYTLQKKKFILNRYNIIKFRYYTYLKFNHLDRQVKTFSE